MAANTRPAALMLSAEAPYPMTGGGALRTASLLHYLARGHTVDLVVFRQPGEADPRVALPAGLVRRVHIIELAENRREMAARMWRNGWRAARGVPPLVDRFGGYGAQLEAALGGERFEVGVIEHFWCAPYVTLVEAACERTYLDLHNVESVLHERVAAGECGPMALLHRRFRAASHRLEREWLPRFRAVLAASDADAARVNAIAPRARVSVYRNALPARPLPSIEQEEAVVFSGNMEYHPNVSAVRFFRESVWPGLRARWPRLVWRLVGKNAESVRRYTQGDERIEVLGAVEDAVAEIARCQVAVVPLLAGSGTRLKILEAWAAGVPVVSTAIGAEGLPVRDGENLILADGGEELCAAVSSLLADGRLRKAIAASGRETFERGFTWEAAWQSLEL